MGEPQPSRRAPAHLSRETPSGYDGGRQMPSGRREGLEVAADEDGRPAAMNILILGDGPEEQAWARALIDHPAHRLWAACPGLKAFPHLPGGPDLDGTL